MLEFGDVITLENDVQYVIASSCVYNAEDYVYLVNIKNCQDCILGKVKNDDLEIIQDEEMFVKIMPLILDNVDSSIFEEGVKNE